MNNFADTDGGPTKSYLMTLKDDPENKKYYDWSFAQRQQEELYDMENDPYQLNNIADQKDYTDIKNQLKEQLFDELEKSQDPRVIGGGEKFDSYPYRAGYKLKK